MYLVIGSTGNIGGQLVKLLLDQGRQARALVRDASRAEQLLAGIDIAVGDLDDADSLTAAARGVDGVFFMQVNPDPEQAESMVAAAKANGVRKLVVLSSIGTVLEPLPMIGARIAARDQVLRRSGSTSPTCAPTRSCRTRSGGCPRSATTGGSPTRRTRDGPAPSTPSTSPGWPRSH